MGWRHRFGNVRPLARVCAQGWMQRSRRNSSLFTAAFGLLTTEQCLAANPFAALEHINDSQGIVGVSVVVALVIFCGSTAILHLTGRRRWTPRETQLVSDRTSARAALARAELRRASGG